jgi:tetratricopeptide (TPR) repeat protein
VETVRMLVSEGRLVEEGGVYVPRGDLTTLAVPETLQALIASRLDGLDETERRLVHDAAVLGQSFSVSALAAVAEVGEAELEPRLASLVRRELLTREMDARSAERGQYAFVQALIREVAYNTLSKRDRKKLHLAASRYFESLGNDELAGVLASHYLSAHANAAEGEEASALAGQARIALKAAAARASALGSFDQAVGFLEQALVITAQPHEQFELLMQAARDTRSAGRLAHAEELIRRAIDIATASEDRDQVIAATVRLADILVTEYKVDEGADILIPALRDWVDIDDEVMAELNVSMARVHYLRGEFRESLALLDNALETIERRGLMTPFAYAMILRGNSLWSTGRRREAFGVTQVGLKATIDHGLTEVELRIRGNLANALTETDAASAFEAWTELLALTRKLGQRGLLNSGVGNYVYSALLAGHWDEGLAEGEAMLADDISDKDRLVIQNNVSIIRVARGISIADDLAELERVGRTMSGKWDLFLADPEANAALVAGDFRMSRDKWVYTVDSDPGTANEYLPRATRPALWARDVADARALTARYEELGDYGPVADARRATLKAGIAALEGRAKEALALYRDALRFWRETHSVWDEALTGVDMAMLLDPAEPEVAAAIKSTRAILDRLGAKPYLERLDAAVAAATSASVARSPRESAVPEIAVTD